MMVTENAVDLQFTVRFQTDEDQFPAWFSDSISCRNCNRIRCERRFSEFLLITLDSYSDDQHKTDDMRSMRVVFRRQEAGGKPS